MNQLTDATQEHVMIMWKALFGSIAENNDTIIGLCCFTYTVIIPISEYN